MIAIGFYYLQAGLLYYLLGMKVRRCFLHEKCICYSQQTSHSADRHPSDMPLQPLYLL